MTCVLLCFYRASCFVIPATQNCVRLRLHAHLWGKARAVLEPPYWVPDFCSDWDTFPYFCLACVHVPGRAGGGGYCVLLLVRPCMIAPGFLWCFGIMLVLSPCVARHDFQKFLRMQWKHHHFATALWQMLKSQRCAENMANFLTSASECYLKQLYSLCSIYPGPRL